MTGRLSWRNHEITVPYYVGMEWIWLGLTTAALTAVLLCVVRGTRLPGEVEAAEIERWFARHARRLWALFAGTLLILAGLLIAPLPGPGFLILAPLGIAMLAAEFVWARRLLNQMERHTAGVNLGVNWFVRRTRLWLAVFLFLAFAAGATVVGLDGRAPGYILWPCTSIGFTVTSIITIRSWRRHRRYLAKWRLRRERQAALGGVPSRAA